MYVINIHANLFLVLYSVFSCVMINTGWRFIVCESQSEGFNSILGHWNSRINAIYVHVKFVMRKILSMSSTRWEMSAVPRDPSIRVSLKILGIHDFVSTHYITYFRATYSLSLSPLNFTSSWAYCPFSSRLVVQISLPCSPWRVHSCCIKQHYDIGIPTLL